MKRKLIIITSAICAALITALLLVWFIRIKPIAFPHKAPQAQIPQEENAAYYYVKAIEALSPGEPPPGSASSADKYQGDLDQFTVWVKANEPAFELVRTGTQQEKCLFPPLGNNIDWLVRMRELARRCADAGFLAELNGDTDKAVQYYLLCVQMGNDISREGPSLQSLIGTAILAIGVGHLERAISNHPVSTEVLVNIRARCREARTETTDILAVLEREMDWQRAQLPPTARIAWATYGDGRLLARAKKDLALPLPELCKNPEFIEGINAGIGSNGEWEAWCRWRLELARTNVNLRAMELRIAILEYQQKHSELPNELQALTPDILAELPLDPFTGQDFHYIRQGSHWQLWSIGPDLINDEVLPVKFQRFTAADFVFGDAVESNIDDRSGKVDENSSAESGALQESESLKPSGKMPASQ